MPVIFDMTDHDHWLNPAMKEPKNLARLPVLYHGEEFTAYLVSTRVNNPRYHDPRVHRAGLVETLTPSAVVQASRQMIATLLC
jgi:putative SOS response-associated peptidase YedK